MTATSTDPTSTPREGGGPHRGAAVARAASRADRRHQVRRQRHDRRRAQARLRRRTSSSCGWPGCKPVVVHGGGPQITRDARPARHRQRVQGRAARHHARGDGRRPDGADRPGAARARRADQRARPARRRPVRRGRRPVHGRSARTRSSTARPSTSAWSATSSRSTRRRCSTSSRRAASRSSPPSRPTSTTTTSSTSTPTPPPRRSPSRSAPRSCIVLTDVEGLYARLAGQRRRDQRAHRRRAGEAAADLSSGHGPQDGAACTPCAGRRRHAPPSSTAAAALDPARDLHRRGHRHRWWCPTTSRPRNAKWRQDRRDRHARRLGSATPARSWTPTACRSGCWSAARAPTCGTPTASATSTSSAASRSTRSGTRTRPLVEAVTEQLATLGHVSNFFASRAAGRARRAAARSSSAATAAAVFFTNSGAEANEAAFKIARRTGPDARWSPPRAPSTAARWARSRSPARRRYRDALRAAARATSPSCRSATSRRSQAARHRRDARPSSLEPIQGEAGVVVRPTATSRGPRDHRATTVRCSGSTRCRPASAAPGAGSRTSRQGVEPDVDHPRQGPRRRDADRRLSPSAPRPTSSRPGSTAPPSAATRSRAPPRSPSSTRSSGTASSSTRRHVASSCRTRSLAAEPRVSEVRGRGLLLGVGLSRAGRGAGRRRGARAGLHRQRPDARRVRLAPPLIIGDAEVDAFVPHCRHPRRAYGGPDSMTAALLPRDDDLTPAEQTEVLDLAVALKKDRYAPSPSPGRSRRGDLRQVVDPHPGVVRRRCRRARRQPAGLDGHARPGWVRRVDRRHRAGAGAARSPRSSGAPTGRTRIEEMAADTAGPRRQRAHRRLPPVPAPRRPADHSGAPRRRSPGCTLTYLGDGAQQHGALVPARVRARGNARARRRRPRTTQPDAVVVDAEAIAATTGGSVTLDA